ncbi:hypothetical protein CH296_28015 [Rhodococcus sp. 14-2496-1d]|uniref:hypothetical protein n=1 Tax=Rhodococcus sp. 14-2496-1d TaxID=2023146 RepID=UPI000B9AB3B9|nr:hypothetical protein [Rhodococcus sp. 14-2496-1d]OZF25189.1 hypothetical protein CH296_28015 [Rhodococcus sp. 14-2496-1d]
MAEKNVIDLITDKVVEQVSATFEGALIQLEAAGADARSRLDDTLEQIRAEGRSKLDELFDVGGLPLGGPVITEDGDFDPVGWIKTQARSRALRTLVQSLLAVVVMAVGNVVVQALTQGTLNVFSWDDWKVVGTLAGSAALASGIAYVQNKFGIKPPKVT